jgi:hypothetical protein
MTEIGEAKEPMVRSTSPAETGRELDIAERVSRQSRARLEREVTQWLAEGGGLYWPGGTGEAGSRKHPADSKPDVRPHARTSPLCRRCGTFHTAAEHARHERTGSALAGPATRARRTKAPRTKRKAAKKTPRTSTPLVVVRKALAGLKGEGRFGPRKVFIAALWRRVGSQLGMSLPELKSWLFEQHRARELLLARADLVAAMDPKLVAESAMQQGNAEFHFVVDSSAKESWP